MSVNTTRYVAKTAIGKPLYIVAETKAFNSATSVAVSHYSLTEDLLEASKCVNKETAKTLIADYISATGSTKSFHIYCVNVTYTIEDEAIKDD